MSDPLTLESQGSGPPSPGGPDSPSGGALSPSPPPLRAEPLSPWEAPAPVRENPWDNWDAKERFANKLIASGFMPSNVKTAAQVIAIILTGRELGIPEMQSIRQIHVISGKPTMSAELMLAKMLKGGVKIQWVRSDAKVATMKASRPHTSFTGSYTIDEAIAAGLTGKDGWKKYPAAMLRARVISLVGRVVAPDLISGMYTPEEMGADVSENGQIRMIQTGLAPMVEEFQDVVPGGTGEMTDQPTPASLIQEFQAATTAAEVDAIRARAKALAMAPEQAMEVTAAWLDAKRRTAAPVNSDL